MMNRTIDYDDYDQIIEGLVDFWMNRRPSPRDEYNIFCGLLDLHLFKALDELPESIEIEL